MLGTSDFAEATTPMLPTFWHHCQHGPWQQLATKSWTPSARLTVRQPGVWARRMAKRLILLMEEILHHLGCVRPYRHSYIYYINWCNSFHQQYHVKGTDVFWRWEPSWQEVCSSFCATWWWTCSEQAGLAEAVAMLYKQPKQTCFDMCLGIFTCSLVSKSPNSNSLKVFFSVSASAKVWFVAWKFS